MDLFRRRRIDAHIDMTPMIDTLLQLFLIFMVGTTLATSTIDINLPRGKKNDATTGDVSRSVVVSIDADNRLYLDNRPIARNRLQADLRLMLESSKDLTVLLKADKKLLYQQFIQIMAEIRQTGATTVLLAYYPEE